MPGDGDSWLQKLGVTWFTYGDGSDSDDYQQGYQDGLTGEESNPGPRDGDAMDNYTEGYAKGLYDFNQKSSGGATGSTGTARGYSSGPQAPAGDSAGMNPTDASPEEQPQSMEVGGLPAFRYTFFKEAIATASIETPEASIELELSLRGSVTVTFSNAPAGVSLDIDTGGWRLQATQALGPITEGLRVNGIGTNKPSIGVTLGSKYSITEYRFEPPNSMLFIGQNRIEYTVPSKKLGPVAVLGQPGFEMKVSVYPHPTVPETAPEPDSQKSWFERNAAALELVGLIVLVGIAIAAAPETGGASLEVLGEI